MGKHYTDPLAFILDGAAESISDERCTDLEPSRKLQRMWGQWDEACVQAMLDWGEANGKGDEIAALVAASDPAGKVDIPYDVYMTLDGAGVGMWDGRWDQHLDRKSIKNLQNYLGGHRTGDSQGVLGEVFSEINQAIYAEAEDDCAHLRGTQIVDDYELNGLSRAGKAVPRQPRWIRPRR